MRQSTENQESIEEQIKFIRHRISMIETHIDSMKHFLEMSRLAQVDIRRSIDSINGRVGSVVGYWITNCVTVFMFGAIVVFARC